MATALDAYAFDDALTILFRRAEARGWVPANVAGISMGGCVSAIGTERTGAFRSKAHCHNHKGDVWQGWICVLSPSIRRLITESGNPTALFGHEYAHLLAPSTGHGERWRKAVTALGFPAEAKR